jgi:DNA-binding NtrC family response regulator
MTPLVLVVDDEKRFQQLYADILSEAGYTVKTAASAEKALDIIREKEPAMIISDVRMQGMNGLELLSQVRQQFSEIPFLLVTAYSNVRDAVGALKFGAVDYLEKPVDLDELLIAVGEALGHSVENVIQELPENLLEGVIAKSPAMQALLRDAFRVASSDATILLTGESGTGKDVVANFIHRTSRRSQAPMVAVNCGAIPSTLLAGELFGHKKGAFTGADVNRKGYFREAATGTIFLDEIGNMPLELQSVLLRVIESGCVVPLGSSREEPVDFRLIAATNTNLETAVKTGAFREDLYYRLNVISFELPPLRDRLEEVEPLVRLFLQAKGKNQRLSPAAASMLRSYGWPGNIRELQNAIERSALLSGSNIILPEHLPPAIRELQSCPPENTIRELTTLRQSELSTIQQALNQTNGNRTKAAQILGISRRTLIYKIKQYGL